MQLNEPRCYHFTTADQWRAGVAERLEIGDSGLQLASSLKVELLRGTSAADSTAALAVDLCGTPYWVREKTFELVRALPDGIQILGQLNISPDEMEARQADHRCSPPVAAHAFNDRQSGNQDLPLFHRYAPTPGEY